MNNFHSNIKWYLITIDDPKALPGESIFNIIKLTLKIIKFNFAVLEDVIGAGLGIIALEKKENLVIEVNELLNELCNVKQFDWCDFFLFKEYPVEWKTTPEATYPFVISKTDTTIRAVDDRYIYIYTPNEELKKIIITNYNIESIKYDFLENLDYPA